MHNASWSVNLETPEYDGNEERVLTDALVAVEHTQSEYHVNLVTHGENGHLRTYHFDAFDDVDSVDYEYIKQCRCGGYVTRVMRTA